MWIVDPTYWTNNPEFFSSLRIKSDYIANYTVLYWIFLISHKFIINNRRLFFWAAEAQIHSPSHLERRLIFISSQFYFSSTVSMAMKSVLKNVHSSYCNFTQLIHTLNIFTKQSRFFKSEGWKNPYYSKYYRYNLRTELYALHEHPSVPNHRMALIPEIKFRCIRRMHRNLISGTRTHLNRRALNTDFANALKEVSDSPAMQYTPVIVVNVEQFHAKGVFQVDSTFTWTTLYAYPTK